MNDKWSMFKNYMHNELGITKDDIRVWIKEAVHEEATNIIHNTFGKFDVKDITKDLLKEIVFEKSWNKELFHRAIIAETAKILAERINMNVGENHS